MVSCRVGVRLGRGLRNAYRRFGPPAATYYWTTPSGTGGNGVWDTVAAANWGPDMTGDTGDLLNWPNTGTDTAEFYTGSGSVIVNNTQSVGNINFDAGTAYSLSGGTLNMSPGAPSPPTATPRSARSSREATSRSPGPEC